jgi:hypothetical protein
MSYNRFVLERVGLEIIYNRRGQVVDILSGRGYAHNQDNDHRYLVAGGQTSLIIE